MARTYRRRLWIGPLLLASWFQGGCYLMDKKPADVSKGELVQPKVVDDALPPAPPKERPSNPQTSRLPEPKTPIITPIDESDDLVMPRGELSQVASVTRLPRTPSNAQGESSPSTPQRPALTIVKNVPPGDELPDSPAIVSNLAADRRESDLPLPRDAAGPARIDIHPRATSTTSGERPDQPANDKRDGRNFEPATKPKSEEELKALEARYIEQVEQRDQALRASSAELQRAAGELQKARQELQSSQRDIDRLRSTNSDLQDSLKEAIQALEKKVKDTPAADR
jgi:hypothetical protein